MATTHIDRMREHPSPDAARAVSEELHALALRRATDHDARRKGLRNTYQENYR